MVFKIDDEDCSRKVRLLSGELGEGSVKILVNNRQIAELTEIVTDKGKKEALLINDVELDKLNIMEA